MDEDTVSRRRARDLQVQFVTGVCLMVAGLLPLVNEWHGSITAGGWLQLAIGALGVFIAARAVVKQFRRP